MKQISENSFTALRAIFVGGIDGLNSGKFAPHIWRSLVATIRARSRNGLSDLVAWTPDAPDPVFGVSIMRLTNDGFEAIGEKPFFSPRSSHRPINQNHVAALQRMNKPPYWPNVPGYEFDPYELRALQGLCREDRVIRLVGWRHAKGGQDCVQSEMELEPKDMIYWLTNNGKLWALGKLSIEVRLRTTRPALQIVKRPPDGDTIAKIKAAMRGDGTAWENET